MGDESQELLKRGEIRDDGSCLVPLTFKIGLDPTLPNTIPFVLEKTQDVVPVRIDGLE